MATAPEFFDCAAPAEIEVAAAPGQHLIDGLRDLGRMMRYGAVGAALAMAALVVVAAADARLMDSAFAQIFGWF